MKSKRNSHGQPSDANSSPSEPVVHLVVQFQGKLNLVNHNRELPD
jgi:hypothetical protein